MEGSCLRSIHKETEAEAGQHAIHLSSGPIVKERGADERGADERGQGERESKKEEEGWEYEKEPVRSRESREDDR